VRRLISVIAMVLWSGAAVCSGTNCPRIFYSPHHLYVGLDFDWQQHQPITGTRPNGDLWGVAAEYDYIHSCDWYVGAEVTWAAGNLTDGLKTRNRDLDIQGKWGYTWFYSLLRFEGYAIPFVGVGYRNLRQDFVSVPGDTSVPFTYGRWYVPIGFRTAVLFCRGWELGLNFTFRWDVDTSRHINADNVRAELDRQFGFEVQLPVVWHLCPTRRCGWEARAVPFWRWDRFGNTPISPNNAQFDQQDWGIYLQIGYRI
jgi:hypothetical protein